LQRFDAPATDPILIFRSAAALRNSGEKKVLSAVRTIALLKIHLIDAMKL